MTQISLRNELYRKGLHFLLLLVPISYCYLGKWPSVAIFATIAAIVVPLDYMRRRNEKIKVIFEKIFGIVLRHHELEGNQLCGASFVAIAACVNFLIFKAEIAVTGFTILVISDAAAALIGRSFPSRPFFEKSLNGAAAFFITGLIILITCGFIFHSRAWFYIFGLFSLFVVTMIESRPSLLKIDDNLTIPLGFAITMTIFDLTWNYIH
jgi:dolichol kinase